MRINVRGTSRRFRVTAPGAVHVSHEEVAQALGAEQVGPSRTRPVSPVAILALRERVGRLLKSTGGRPALEGAAARKKIPLQEGDWPKLQEIAAKVEGEGGVKATPGQIAAVLLHEAIEMHGHRSRPRQRRRAPLK